MEGMDVPKGSFGYCKHVYKCLALIRFHSSKSKHQNSLEIPKDSIKVQSQGRAWCDELCGYFSSK